MRIKIADLRRAADLLIQHLSESGVESIELEDDLYWDLPTSIRYDVHADVPGAETGRIGDDWREVQGMLEGRQAPIGYGLVWLAAVLRRVGEKHVG